jgi:hypothetical protein
MLSWRVPTTGDPSLLRLALAQVALASVVAALILFVAVPREWLVPALLGLIPLTVFMAYRRWRTYHMAFTGPDNVRLDEDGLFWNDSNDDEQSFRRFAVTGFHISRDADTLRPVPSLTLHLQGRFESQPIELHPPATSDVVRRFLSDNWHLTEQPRSSDAGALNYDSAIAIYSECHDDYQEWHFEGSRDELRRLFEVIESAARELALPPPGAKPLSRTIRCTRREPQRLRIAVSRSPHLDDDTIALPPDLLTNLSSRALAALSDGPDDSDAKTDLRLSASSAWTFHFHIR